MRQRTLVFLAALSLGVSSCSRETAKKDPAPLQEFKIEGHNAPIVGVEFSADGKWLATASKDKTARLWNLQDRKQTAQIDFVEEVFAVAFSPDGKWLVAGDSKGRMAFWNRATQKIDKEVTGGGGSVTAIAFNAKGDWMAYAAPNFVYFWPAQEALPKVAMIDSIFAGYIVKALAFSSDGRWLAAARNDKIVAVYDAAAIIAAIPTLKRLDGDVHLDANPVLRPVAVKRHGDEVRAVWFTRDGHQLISAGLDKTVRVWETGTWKEAKSFTAAEPIFNMTGNDRSREIAFSSGNQTRIFDIASGRDTNTLKGGALRLAMSRDGRWLARSMGKYVFVQELKHLE